MSGLGLGLETNYISKATDKTPYSSTLHSPISAVHRSWSAYSVCIWDRQIEGSSVAGDGSWEMRDAPALKRSTSMKWAGLRVWKSQFEYRNLSPWIKRSRSGWWERKPKLQMETEMEMEMEMDMESKSESESESETDDQHSRIAFHNVRFKFRTATHTHTHTHTHTCIHTCIHMWLGQFRSRRLPPLVT